MSELSIVGIRIDDRSERAPCVQKNLLNIYHVMQVNPEKFPKEIKAKMNTAGARAFVEFMVAPETQKMIGQFGVDKFGQPLFYPDAGKKEEDLGK